VVVPDAEDVEPDLIGKLDLLQEVAEALPRADLVRRELRKGEDSEFH
jgi:hypothetical protein